MNQKNLNCKRCGKCCIVKNFKKDLWEDCQFLIHQDFGKTKCKIYKRRLKKHLGNFQFCTLRKYALWDIPNCPFNTDKPMHPAYNQEVD